MRRYRTSGREHPGAEASHEDTWIKRILKCITVTNCTHTSVCAHAQMHTQTHARAYATQHMHAHACVHTHTHMRIRAHKRMRAHMHTHSRAHMHTHSRAHTHERSHIFVLFPYDDNFGESPTCLFLLRVYDPCRTLRSTWREPYSVTCSIEGENEKEFYNKKWKRNSYP